MPNKTFTPEQIVANLRQIEVLVRQTVLGARTCIGTLEVSRATSLILGSLDVVSHNAVSVRFKLG